MEYDDNLPSGEADDDDNASAISEDEASHQLDKDLKRQASVIQLDQEDTTFQQPEPTYPQQKQEIANLTKIFGQSPTTKEFNITNILFKKYRPLATFKQALLNQSQEIQKEFTEWYWKLGFTPTSEIILTKHLEHIINRH